MKVLIIEDELDLNNLVSDYFKRSGEIVISAFNKFKAEDAFINHKFDVIILDIMLPGIDGYSIIETVRIHNNNTPILILSAKNTSANRVQGLKIGADDYMTKPFNLEELLLRVSKLIQKSGGFSAVQNNLEQYSFSDNIVHFTLLEARLYNGEKIHLTKKEAMLLKLLIDNKNTIITRERILQSVWGYNVFPNTRTIDNFILNFRKYFELDPKLPLHFISIRGVGYKFQD